MKKPHFIRQDKVRDYLRSLWNTQEFKDAHCDENSFLYEITKKFATQSRGFVTRTADIEEAHFLTWMNFILHRSYDNPYLHDLYYLHEISHLANMTYDPNAAFYTWFQKMQDNERHAAVTSEVLIHLHMKAEQRPIRDKAFDKPIWADRYLNNVDTGKKPSQRLINEIFAKRRAITADQVVDQITEEEQVLQRFNDQNLAWAKIWGDDYQTIERYLSDFIEADNQTRGDSALQELHGKLQQHSRDGVIFKDQARQFHQVYQAFNILTDTLHG